jgi:hypothetical protein
MFGLFASMSLRVPKKWPHSFTSDGTSFAGNTGPHLYGVHSEFKHTCTPTLTCGCRLRISTVSSSHPVLTMTLAAVSVPSLSSRSRAMLLA